MLDHPVSGAGGWQNSIALQYTVLSMVDGVSFADAGCVEGDGPPCTSGFPAGTMVTLTAAPVASSSFTGWSGACSGTSATCIVTVRPGTSVTATFTCTTALGVYLQSVVQVSIYKNGMGMGTQTCTGVPPNFGCYDFAEGETALITYDY